MNLYYELSALPVFADTTWVGGDNGAQTQQQAEVGVANGQPAAAPAADAPGGMGIFTIGIWVLMFAAIYFLILRPQKKKEKAVRQMQTDIKVSDNIVTSSGFFGKVVSIGTDSFLIEFGEGKGFRVWVRKSDIAGIRTPVMTPPIKEAESPSK